MRKFVARTCREKSRSPRKANSIRLIFTRSSRQNKRKKTFGLDARGRRMIHRDPASLLMAILDRHRSLRRNEEGVSPPSHPKHAKDFRHKLNRKIDETLLMAFDPSLFHHDWSGTME